MNVPLYPSLYQINTRVSPQNYTRVKRRGGDLILAYGSLDRNDDTTIMTAAFIKILVSITLMAMMVAIGLEVSLAELAAAARNWRLTTKAALANYLCIPAVTVSLLLLFHPADATVAAGFLILAVCPGAPFGPACTGLARGNVAAARGDDGAAGRLVGHCRTSAIASAFAASVE